ncbi:hypothetical protein PHSC3_000500 [Chlamydiales bacterium STE3]|nr:hypothetical protein PHSC3_000500 [Chlamydiales bacterium STE3]
MPPTFNQSDSGKLLQAWNGQTPRLTTTEEGQQLFTHCHPKDMSNDDSYSDETTRCISYILEELDSLDKITQGKLRSVLEKDYHKLELLSRDGMGGEKCLHLLGRCRKIFNDKLQLPSFESLQLPHHNHFSNKALPNESPKNHGIPPNKKRRTDITPTVPSQSSNRIGSAQTFFTSGNSAFSELPRPLTIPALTNTSSQSPSNTNPSARRFTMQSSYDKNCETPRLSMQGQCMDLTHIHDNFEELSKDSATLENAEKQIEHCIEGINQLIHTFPGNQSGPQLGVMTMYIEKDKELLARIKREIENLHQ